MTLIAMKTTLSITVISLLSFALSSFQGDELKASIDRGKSVYESNCMSCHMDKGQGIPGAFPPLANTSRLTDKGKLVKIILDGASGPITLNGVEYTMEMNPVPLSDEQVADVLNYIRNSWGNKGPMITVEEVKKLAEEK